MDKEKEEGKIGGEAESVVRSLLAHPYARSVAIRFLLLQYRDEIITADKEWCERIDGIVNHTWRPWYIPGVPPPDEEIVTDQSKVPPCFPSNLGIASLTNSERVVLIALVKAPHASLESLARELSIGSSHICELRRRAFIKLNLPPINGKNNPFPKKNRELLLSNYEKAAILLQEAGYLDP